MSPQVPIIGFTGAKLSGKDMTFARMQLLFGAGTYQRASFADPLKRSLAGIYGLTVDQVEQMKNDPSFRLTIVHLRGAGQDMTRSQSMREVMQAYGKTMRETFGEDFWVKHALEQLEAGVRHTYVFTDVRHDNEAQAIIDAGGMVIGIEGPQIEETDNEEELRIRADISEAGINPELIFATIDNTTRPSFEVISKGGQEAQDEMQRCIAALDDEVARIHAELQA